jgi:hypothetical protein
MNARQHADRRILQRYPFRNRWLIVNARERATWREVWYDLLYLIRG